MRFEHVRGDRVTVACLPTHAVDGVLAARLRTRAAVRPFDDRRALMTHVRTHPVAAVVLELRDGAGRSTSGTVRALRAAAPRLPVLARCRLTAPDCRALLDFARAGGTDVLVDGDDGDALLALLPAACPSADAPHAPLVARLLAAGVPTRFGALLEYTFAHLDDPTAPARAHDAIGVSRRALERRLARAALPPPRTLHSWCRLLAAADRLTGDAVAVERIALDVGFPSANALRNALQRYGATTPSAVRASGGVDALVGRLCGGDAVPAPRRVAERAALVGAIVDHLASGAARREGRRPACASNGTAEAIIAPRSSRRTSAARRGVTNTTHRDGREA